MPEFCTCGTELVPGSLFCHKCGKPQREIVAPEAPEPAHSVEFPEFEPASTPAQPPPLNLRNPVAVRIALLLALSATILSILPLVNWLAAGFFAVFFYRRKTGRLLNVSAGMRMGWLTGLFSFAMFVLVFTLEELPAALSGQLAANIQEQVRNLPALDPSIAQQVGRMLNTGSGIAEYLLFSMMGLFLFITCFSIAGGALGAKLVGRP
jgi:hypothetical protein